MTNITKILLAIALSGFALGSTGLLWRFGLPVGAIFFGWFMIFWMLEKEVALYDEEEKLRLAEAMQASKRLRNPQTETPRLPVIAVLAHSR
jgi:hypothetical protein